MPLRTKTVDLKEEADRLQAELETLREKAAEMDEVPEVLIHAGERLQTQLRGVEWAQAAHEDDDVDVWDADVETVTLGGLTGGEFAALEDTIAADVAARGHDGPTNGANRVHLVAAGTVDAPYHDPEAPLTERVATASKLPLAYQKWVEATVNDLTSVGNGDGRSFRSSVAAKRAEQTSDGT